MKWPTNRKSYMIYRTSPFSMTLNDPYPRFQGHSIFYTEYLINGTIYRHSFNEILIGTYTLPTVVEYLGISLKVNSRSFEISLHRRVDSIVSVFYRFWDILRCIMACHWRNRIVQGQCQRHYLIGHGFLVVFCSNYMPNCNSVICTLCEM